MKGGGITALTYVIHLQIYRKDLINFHLPVVSGEFQRNEVLETHQILKLKRKM